MILPLAGALILATSADPLQEAQSALVRGDYALAESLAAPLSQPPIKGTALNLVGLARFRAGRPAEALVALDEAGKEPDSPPEGRWRYNRAACLYDLGRFEDAEQEYLRAARLDPSLKLVALVNAGFAAVDGGAAQRAAELARQARAEATGGALDLVRELDELIATAREHHAPQGFSGPTSPEYRAGLAAYDARRFTEALAHFLAAEAQDSDDGRTRIMLGATDLKLGDRPEARAELATALSLPLDAAELQIARDYVASMSHGLASRGRGFDLAVRLGLGFDTNYLQSGAVDFGATAGTPTAAPVATTSLSASWRTRALPWLFTELSYGFDQYAYLSEAAQDYSIQQHALNGLLELSPRDWVRFGVSATGNIDLVGILSFRPLEVGGGAGAWAELDEHDRTTSRIGADWRQEVAPGSEFSYLTGSRIDATFSQSLRLGPTTTELEYQYRDEAIGTLDEPVTLHTMPNPCALNCPEEFIIPFGYTSHTVGLSFRATLASIIHLGVAGGVEWRTYDAQSALQVSPGMSAPFDVDQRLRRDTRIFGSAFVGAQVWKRLDISLHYDFVVNRSNIDDDLIQGPESGCGPPAFSCHQLDYDDKNYTKHVLLLETGYSW